MEHMGAMKRLSPCEFVHALLGGAALAAEKQVPDAVKRQWNAILRSVTLRFQKLTEDQVKNGMSIAAFSHRETLVQDMERA
eukprot:8007361-Pyramimonas_sp.AAC.1